MKKTLFILGLIVLFGITAISLSQPQMPGGSLNPSASLSLDPYAPVRIARDCSTNDAATTNYTAANYTALTSANGDSAVNKLQFVRGAKNIALRLVAADSSDSNATNATVTMTVYGWKRGVNGAAAKGFTLWTGAITFGSDVTTNADPFGYDTTTNGGWYEADTLAETKDSGGASLVPNTIYDGAGDNRQARTLFDPQGCDAFYIVFTGRSGLTNIRAYWWPVL